MQLDVLFFLNSILLGVGLAMDAFSVSVANGLNDPGMGKRKALLIPGVFAGFQILMPLIGWICVHTIVQYFKAFERFIPWIALFLLCFIGIKMILEGIRYREEAPKTTLGFGALLVQGIATSIDALSVGFTIEGYNVLMAVTAALIIGIVTFFICVAGLKLGRLFGTKISGRASILGGLILIGIGLEIFLTGILG